MKALPLELKKNTYLYKQIKRTDKVAMYEQINPETSNIVGYEVFIIKIQKEVERWIGGKNITFERKERFPTDNMFGETAWSHMTRSSAEKKYADLCLGMKN